MLSKEDNELITRTGPGTIMGNLIRQYWVPACLSSEIPAPDCPPLRVRLLSENLIAFRATSGKVGLIANACPHRGASMFFGRNEEEGLRCVYHGWKFDVTGACVDMPSEPPDSNFKNKVNAITYPCIERGGLVWTYMGPRETPPSLPDIEPNMVAENVMARGAYSNWMQVMENNLDTSHLGFLHGGAVDPEANDPRLNWWLDFEDRRDALRFRAPTFLMHETEYGATAVARRPVEDDENVYSYRLGNWHFPFYTQHSGGAMETRSEFTAVVPVDDTYTISYKMGLQGRYGFVPEAGRKVLVELQASPFLENNTDWLGRFRPAVTMATDFGIDREVQAHEKNTMRGYTGIETTNDQDRGIVESQGSPQDRTIEHLATTDRLIILMRKRLLDAAKALADHGTVPPGVDQPAVYRQRSGSFRLQKGLDPWEATKEKREVFKRTGVRTTPAI